MEPKLTILVVEDDPDVADMLHAYFQAQGYDVITVHWGADALKVSRERRPDLVILDIRLPDIDGYQVAARLRSNRRTEDVPILFLTEKRTRDDRLRGLELGADDYVTKPFSPRELTARIKALLRRSAGIRQPAAIIRSGSLSVDTASHEVRCGGKTVDLTATEYRLLYFLASHPGYVYSRSAIMDGALGKDINVLERTIDVHIMSLRRKLGKCGQWIETIRGFGYKFREEFPPQ
jgi:two-component system, OmpR family, alkaline phosphatase synthesis response regulator PhoP